ncbi:adhesin/invasin tiba translocator [Gluconobacter frateurii NBRC 103465]|nr:adhesin/invasin tiba translocator [Gluconobacter frateurii NBRC 103465]
MAYQSGSTYFYDASPGSVSNNGTISGTVTSFGGTTYVQTYYANIGFGGLSGATAGSYGAIIARNTGSNYAGTNLTATANGALLASGGTIGGATVGASAAALAFGSGTITNFNVANGGAIFVGNMTGTAAAQALTGKGITSLSGPGFINSGTISAGGTEIIASGGTGQNTTVHGAQYVSAGGLSISDTVNSAGVQNLLSGATANQTTVGSGGTTIASSGAHINSVTVAGGTVNNGGILNGAVVQTGKLEVTSGGTASGVTVQSGGTEITDAGGSSLNVIISSGGTAIVQSGGYASGGTINKGGIEVVSSGATVTGMSILSGGSLVVNSGASLTNTVISSGAVIDVDNLTYASGGTVHLSSNGVLTVTEGANTWTTTFTGAVSSNDYFVVTKDTDGSTVLTFVCFLAGTLIRTDNGEATVESLNIGDNVVTYVEGREVIQPVVWVGKKTAHVKSGLPLDEAGYPVRVLKDAISAGVPHQDLLVTPEHCFYFEGRFIPARMLVNGKSVFYDTTMTTYDYYHVETESHSILWSNGALTESYLDTGNRQEFGQQGKVVRLTAGPGRDWSTEAAAPLAVARELVEPVYRALENRAEELALPQVTAPFELTNDADLHLVTPAGHRINIARQTENGRVVFMLPAGLDEVRIVSRASRPSDVVGPMVDDRRYFGVNIGEIQLWEGNGKQLITSHLSDADLAGWNGIEGPHGRWTTGNATLKLPHREKLNLSILSLEIRHAGPYVLIDQDRDNKKVVAS